MEENNISAEEQSLEYFLSSNRGGLYVPSYQRNYAWEEKNIKKLYFDLMESFEENPNNDYYMGNIILKNKDKTTEEIVDGQQRITTFLLFIAALNIFKKDLDYGMEWIKDSSLKNYVFYERTDKNRVSKLKIFSSKRNFALEDILECAFKTPNKIALLPMEVKETKYYQNLITFIFLLENDRDKLSSERNFLAFKRFFRKIKFVVITIKDLEVHKIFENINSTGVSLKISDLIKNFLYIELEDKKTFLEEKEKNIIEHKIDDFFEEKLENISSKKNVKEEFFKNYLVYKKGSFTKTETKILYQEIKDVFKKDEKPKTEKILEMINDFSKMFNLWKFIESEYEPLDINNPFDFSFALIKDKLLGTFFPLIFLFAKENNLFTSENRFLYKKEEFQELVILLEKYFSRKILIGSDNKNANKFIPSIIFELRKLNSYKLEDIETFLFKDIDSLSEIDSMEVPQDIDLVIKGLTSINKIKSQTDIKHILYKFNKIILEVSEEVSNFQNISLDEDDFGKYMIEYVMPINSVNNSSWRDVLEEYLIEHDLDSDDIFEVKDRFVYSWGNLTLIKQKEIKKLTNNSFIDKKSFFYNTSLIFNNSIYSKSAWTIKEIIEREDLFKKIIEAYF